jgi:5,5'-dehydrodivanillate O-demethylase
MNDHAERRASRLNRLTETRRDSPMGALLRRFWQPVAVGRKLAPGTAQQLRILSEDLTLYRGESGRPHLVGSHCAHRLTLLSTGWVEDDTIRCMYHGWAYDETGACIERPAERDERPCGVRIAGYPVHEYGGLIFAYLGEGEPPAFELPRKDVFEDPARIMHARSELWNCNWLQMVENSMDAVHVSFVHQKGRSGNFIKVVSQAIPELEYVETEAGIRQIATRGEGNVRISDWTFPNNNHISVPGLEPDDAWIDVGHWNVPIDDEHTYRMNIWSTPAQSAAANERIRAYFDQAGEYDPSHHHDELIGQGRYPADQLFDLTSAQDYVAQRGQGVIADREHEILGRSDAGIALLRRVFTRETDALAAGRTPKAWSKLREAAVLPVQVAAHEGSR